MKIFYLKYLFKGKIVKIKVGDKVFDGEKEPVMVILTNQDKENIKNMLPHCTKYCMFPDTISKEEIQVWMRLEGDKKSIKLFSL